MEVKHGRIPPGPQEKYETTDDLLVWMSRQFRIFGDIYKASVYGTSAYVIRDVEFAHHVLVENWQNYVKGQMTGRVALLLGDGLMVSEGELWKRQKILYESKEWVDYLTDRIPVKRPGQPNDLDAAVVFLAAESSRYVTGQTLLVDGGISTGATRALVGSQQPASHKLGDAS